MSEVLNPSEASWEVFEPWGDFFPELYNHTWLVQCPIEEIVISVRATLRLVDELLHQGADKLRLSCCGGDALVLDELGAQIPEKRVPMRRASSKMSFSKFVPHFQTVSF